MNEILLNLYRIHGDKIENVLSCHCSDVHILFTILQKMLHVPIIELLIDSFSLAIVINAVNI